MGGRKYRMTPLGAVVIGTLAGAVGTASMDSVWFARQRRDGGQQDPLAWEFAPVATWQDAPDPGKFARLVLEGLLQRTLPDRWAWLTSTVMHWTVGCSWGAAYGILAGSLRRPSPLYGLPLGAAVWLSGYLVLPATGIYKPIGEYDPKTLGKDLSAHLAYGAGTGTAFWLLSTVL
jgi:hypothetical protein